MKDFCGSVLPEGVVIVGAVAEVVLDPRLLFLVPPDIYHSENSVSASIVVVEVPEPGPRVLCDPDLVKFRE